MLGAADFWLNGWGAKSLPYSQTWTGADGSAWPAEWTNQGGSAAILADTGQLTTPTGAYTGGRQFLAQVPDLADEEILVDVTMPSTGVEQYVSIALRGDGGANGGDAGRPAFGYGLVLYYNPTDTASSWHLEKYSGATYGDLTSAAFTLDGGVTYRVRFRAVGGVLSLNIWPAASAEPVGWTGTFTDPSPYLTAGRPRLAIGNGADGVSRTGQFDNLTVGAIPLSAAGSITLGGTATASLQKTATLTDDFTTADAAKWGFDANATVTGGRLSLTTSAAYQGAESVGRYDLTGSSLSVEVPQVTNQGNGTVDTSLTLAATSTDNVSFTVEGGLLYAQYEIAGSFTTVAPVVPYDPVLHRWWRISESGGTVAWAVSADGLSWTTAGTWAYSGLNITALQVLLQTGFWGDSEPNPGTALFDNVNVAPPAQASAAGAISLGGTATASVRASATGSITVGAAGTASVRASATGSITLGGSASATTAATGSGGISLGGTATASVRASAAGSITVGGSGSAGASTSATGSVALSGSASSVAASTSAGSLVLAGSGSASARASSTGSLALGGSAIAASTASAAGSITLGGSAAASTAVTAAGSVALGGSAAASVRATATGSVTLGGTGAVTTPGAHASGSLTLDGSATATARASATGGLSLGGTASAAAGVSSTEAITLAGAAQLSALADAAGAITLAGLASPVFSVPASAAGSITLAGLASQASALATAAGSIALAGHATGQSPDDVASITVTSIGWRTLTGTLDVRSLNTTVTARSLIAAATMRTTTATARLES